MGVQVLAAAKIDAQRLGVEANTTVEDAAKALMPHYIRVNGGSAENEVSRARVLKAAEALINQGDPEPWVHRAINTAT